MSEEKPLPCAFCGHDAEIIGKEYLLHCFCPNSSCRFAKFGLGMETWNALQMAIMAMRRKDFEAGLAYKGLSIMVNISEVKEGQKFYSTREATFDDYIKEQSK